MSSNRWWNPAVEDQATDPAFRIGQRHNVQVRKFVCGGTLEGRIDETIEDKKAGPHDDRYGRELADRTIVRPTAGHQGTAQSGQLHSIDSSVAWPWNNGRPSS